MNPAPAVATPLPQRTLRDWLLDEDLARTQRAAQPWRDPRRNSQLRFDDPHQPSTANEPAARPQRSPDEVPVPPATSAPTGGLATRGGAAVGLLLFVAGALLVTVELIGAQAGTLSWGVTLALLGQAGLMSALWSDVNRLTRAERMLRDECDVLQTRLAALRREAQQARSQRGNSAQSFYYHLAEGASPKLLFADLKSQLDLLASKLDDR